MYFTLTSGSFYTVRPLSELVRAYSRYPVQGLALECRNSHCTSTGTADALSMEREHGETAAQATRLPVRELNPSPFIHTSGTNSPTTRQSPHEAATPRRCCVDEWNSPKKLNRPREAAASVLYRARGGCGTQQGGGGRILEAREGDLGGEAVLPAWG